MNDDEIREVEREADRLHFESALQLLQKTGRTETDDTDWHRLMARILRGLSDSRAALDHARNAGTAPRAQLELAKCLFAAGQAEEAGQRLTAICTDSSDLAACLALAAWCAEMGEVTRARNILQSSSLHQLPPGGLRMDWLILTADLASFEENMDTAFRFYRQALHETESCIPSNWQPLRRMLILHNMADSLEQMERPDQAMDLYRQALCEMKQQHRTDGTVTDLSGYEAELLLSVANCLGNMEEYETAHEFLNKADRLLAGDPPRQKSYFHARRLYIGGLLALNESRNTEAAHLFEQALTVQKKLCLSGQDKPEHAARTAYYLASVLPDTETGRKLALYEEAWPVFEQMQDKEPAFYLSARAEMENERGRLSSDRSLGTRHYRYSVALYNQVLALHPEDSLARESRLAARVNLYLLSPCQDLENCIRKELTALQKQSGSLFLDTVSAYLLHSGECSPAFHEWLTQFRQTLPSPYDA